jgi:hypothetical protein
MTTSKKAWLRCDDHCRDEKAERPNERRKKHEAHHLDNRYTSSNDESRDDGAKTVTSGGQSSPESDNDNNFAVAVERPAKKAKKARRKTVVPCKPFCKVIESEDNKALLTEMGDLLNNDPLDVN